MSTIEMFVWIMIVIIYAILFYIIGAFVTVPVMGFNRAEWWIFYLLRWIIRRCVIQPYNNFLGLPERREEARWQMNLKHCQQCIDLAEQCQTNAWKFASAGYPISAVALSNASFVYIALAREFLDETKIPEDVLVLSAP